MLLSVRSCVCLLLRVCACACACVCTRVRSCVRVCVPAWVVVLARCDTFAHVGKNAILVLRYGVICCALCCAVLSCAVSCCVLCVVALALSFQWFPSIVALYLAFSCLLSFSLATPCADISSMKSRFPFLAKTGSTPVDFFYWSYFRFFSCLVS